jgi:hypothetical protein
MSFPSYPNNSDEYLPGVIFIPSTMIITAITQSNPMVITATFNPITAANTYIVGMLITLTVPWVYGMWQANDLTAQITAINGLVFTVNVNSLDFDPFVVPSGNVTMPASFSPAGSQNLLYNNLTNQVAFQPLNDVGN